MAIPARRTGAGTGEMAGPGRAPRRHGRAGSWGGAWGRGAAAALAVSLAAACSADAPPPAVLDAGTVGSVIIGRSSRADVYAALGRPSRTERSASGEAWIYEAGGGGGGANPLGGVATASGLLGAFVPYAGLVGSGLGLAGAAMGGARPDRARVGLTVAFTADGVVRDCVLSSTAVPAGVFQAGVSPAGAPGPVPADAGIVDCRRPGPNALPGSIGAVPGDPGRWR